MSERDGTTRALVSVVICAYNNWPDLEMTIESALHQSYEPIEVIVVDNSSADGTEAEVTRRYASRLQYLRQPNSDGPGAYNTGFTIARGEFIQFVDGDDVLAPNKIAKQMDVFKAKPETDVVYGDIRAFQTQAGSASWFELPTRPVSDMLASLTSSEGMWLDTLGTLFRRSALEKVGRWDESLYIDDADYFLRAAWANCRFGHCPGSPMGFKRLRSGQKTANPQAMERGLDAVWSKALGYIDREPYRSLLAARVADRKLRRVVYREWMPRAEALRNLAQARAASPDTISALTYAVACAAVVLPGGRYLARLPWLGPIRRILAKLLRFRAASTYQKESDWRLRGEVKYDTEETG